MGFVTSTQNQRRLLGWFLLSLLAFVAIWQWRLSGDIVPSAATTKKKKEKKNQLGGIPYEPFFQYLNLTAGYKFPSNFPDNVYLLVQTIQNETEEDTGKYKISYHFEHSMNTYWKHPVSFRRAQLAGNLKWLQDFVDYLNLQEHLRSARWDPATDKVVLSQQYSKNQSSATTGMLLFHQRIHEAGGSFPFLANWRITSDNQQDLIQIPSSLLQQSGDSGGNNNDDDCKIPPSMFPVFQRSVPTVCQRYTDDWTIPTFSLVRQLVDPNQQVKLSVTQQQKQQQQSTVAVARLPESMQFSHDSNHQKSSNASSSSSSSAVPILAVERLEASNNNGIVIPTLEEVNQAVAPDEEHQYNRKRKAPRGYDNHAREVRQLLDFYASHAGLILLATVEEEDPMIYLPTWLCPSNSVLLLMSPAGHQDTLFHTLHPESHFLTFENEKQLVDLVSYILDSSNHDAMQRIRRNAKQWCEQYLVRF